MPSPLASMASATYDKYISSSQMKQSHSTMQHASIEDLEKRDGKIDE